METSGFPASPNVEDRRQSDPAMYRLRSAIDAAVYVGAAGLGFLADESIRLLREAGRTWEYVPGPSRAAAYRVAGRFITRMVPWISAAELAVVLWEINHRRNDVFKETVKVGPAPDDPAYMPDGWSKKWSVFDCYGLTWANTGGFRGGVYTYPTLTPACEDQSVGHYAPTNPAIHDPGNYPTGPGARYQKLAYPGSGGVPVPGDTFGVEFWELDGGPGTTISYYGDVIEWEPPQEAWKVQPDVVPTVMPDITNPGQRQRQAVPIPQRDLWKFPRWKREFGDLIYRESGSPPPTRPSPGDDAVEDPEGSDFPQGQRPPRPRVPPRGDADDVIFTPDGHVSDSIRGRSSHRFLPAPPKAREVKLRANTRRMAYRILSALTEFHDFIGAVHKALPKRCRKSRTWRGSDGKWHRALASSMARDIYNCAGDINIQRAIINVVANSLQDYAVGYANRALNERTGMLGSSLGIQGLGTRLGRASSNDAGHWSTPITNAGDWISSNTQGWTPRDIQRAWRQYTYGY